MLNNRLLDKSYYLNAMSKFLLNSYGTEERYDVYLKILKNLDDVSESIFSRIDIYNVGGWDDSNYFTRNNVDENSTTDAWLDIIASIYNINRTMNITYLDSRQTPEVSVTETITLDNWELFMYIKVIISRLNYQGTAKEIIDLYGNGVPDGTNNNDIKYLGIAYLWNFGLGSAQLSCKVVLNNLSLIDMFNNNTGHQNICKLFLSDKLLIESLGITYNKELGSTLEFARFDSAKFYDAGDQIIYIFV